MATLLERKVVAEPEIFPITAPDVLLVLPPLYQTGRSPDYNPKEPMGLMYLASSLRLDHRKVEIFDADVEANTLQQTVRKIAEKNPPIVGFSVFQRALSSLEHIVKQLREEGYKGHITCGGITPTLSHSYMLGKIGNLVDSIVLGEGENTLRQLTNRVLTGQDWKALPGIAYLKRDSATQVVNSPIDLVDLDTLPFAARDYLDFCLGKTNYATMMGSRGCYGVCTFCSNYSFENFHPGPRWRARNPVSVVDEMQDLFESRGINVFKFNDPNIFGPGNKGRDHVKNLCKELIHRNLKFHLMGFCRGDDITKDPSIVNDLKAAGFERLLVGIESANNVILDRFRKLETIEGMDRALAILHSAGISTVLGFMIFNPYTTIDTLKTDLAFLRRRGDVYPTLCKALRIFDGTPIQTLMEKEGRLVPKNPFEGYHDYVMPKDVAAIYASMKVLFTHCLDKIRAAGQERLWNVKKADSFRDRQDFNSLAEGFFTTESFLLDQLIKWTESPDFNFEAVAETMSRVYKFLELIGHSISVDINTTVSPQEQMVSEIYRIMKERPWNTFREEYRWNED